MCVRAAENQKLQLVRWRTEDNQPGEVFPGDSPDWPVVENRRGVENPCCRHNSVFTNSSREIYSFLEFSAILSFGT